MKTTTPICHCRIHLMLGRSSSGSSSAAHLLWPSFITFCPRLTHTEPTRFTKIQPTLDPDAMPASQRAAAPARLRRRPACPTALPDDRLASARCAPQLRASPHGQLSEGAMMPSGLFFSRERRLPDRADRRPLQVPYRDRVTVCARAMQRLPVPPEARAPGPVVTPPTSGVEGPRGGRRPPSTSGIGRAPPAASPPGPLLALRAADHLRAADTQAPPCYED
mmetsp:Transcript_15978/g.40857  ORF Transcript_15978/g.40857 Transcript_15978/m.40857 type:complete len:221 (+) Transcript_15978:339-1001(+)